MQLSVLLHRAIQAQDAQLRSGMYSQAGHNGIPFLPCLETLSQEVKLWNTNADRERYENLATLYGIIVSLDHLERAYVRDTIRSEA
jgi:hypothetical protein